MLPGGSAKEIALLKEQPFIIGMNDRLWEGRPDGWVQIAGSPSLKRISVNSSNGMIWAITTSNDIIAFNPANGAWMPDPVDGKGKDICALGGKVYVIGNDDHIWQGGGPSGWGRIPGEGRGQAYRHRSHDRHYLGDRHERRDMGPQRQRRLERASVERRWEGPADLQRYPYIIGSDNGVWQSAGANGWEHLNAVEAT